MFTKVTFKDGHQATVMTREVEGLRNAGLLKEDKESNQTKEEKDPGQTKEEKQGASISNKNIKGSRTKKV
jgi:hypothetical protein